MGVYYHGEEESGDNFYSSNNFKYANKPDEQYLCRQCKSVLDTPYKKRVMSVKGQSTNTSNRVGCTGTQVPIVTDKELDPVLDILPEPTSGPVCHTCWLRIPSSVRNTWICDDLLIHHLNQLMIVCTNREKGCEKFLARDKLEVHLKTECPFENVPCVYEKLGCQTHIQRRERRGHEQMCPLATNPDLVLPIILKDVNCLSAIANDVQRHSRVMDSWMDEVDDILRQLSASNQTSTHHIFELVDAIGIGNQPKELLGALNVYHSRLFERTIIVPLQNNSPTFIDLRCNSVDISQLDLAQAGILEVIESISLNRCVKSFTLRVLEPGIIFSALEKSMALNSTLTKLCVMIGSVADEPYIMSTVNAIQSNSRTRLTQLSLIVENSSEADFELFSASMHSQARSFEVICNRKI